MTRKDIEIGNKQVTLYSDVTCEDICKVVSDFFVCGCRGEELNRVYNYKSGEIITYYSNERNKVLIIV